VGLTLFHIGLHLAEFLESFLKLGLEILDFGHGLGLEGIFDLPDLVIQPGQLRLQLGLDRVQPIEYLARSALRGERPCMSLPGAYGAYREGSTAWLAAFKSLAPDAHDDICASPHAESDVGVIADAGLMMSLMSSTLWKVSLPADAVGKVGLAAYADWNVSLMADAVRKVSLMADAVWKVGLVGYATGKVGLLVSAALAVGSFLDRSWASSRDGLPTTCPKCRCGDVDHQIFDLEGHTLFSSQRLGRRKPSDYSKLRADHITASLRRNENIFQMCGLPYCTDRDAFRLCSQSGDRRSGFRTGLARSDCS
jgi:hypothetical protein